MLAALERKENSKQGRRRLKKPVILFQGEASLYRMHGRSVLEILALAVYQTALEFWERTVSKTFRG